MSQPSRVVQALSVLIVGASGGFACAQDSSSADSHASIAAHYANLPLQFEANQGQADARVRFSSHGSGYSLFLTDSEAVLLLSKPRPADVRAAYLKGGPSPQPAGVLRMQLEGAHADAAIAGVDELPGKANYFVGSDPAKWRTGVPTFAKVRYSQIYDGIDLVYYGNQCHLEYDFVVSPSASAEMIRLHFDGAEQLTIDRDGNLRIVAADGTVAFHKPVVYQDGDGGRHPVEGRFALLAGNSVGFELGAYDHAQPLVIDPILEYATYLGGSTWDEAWAIAVDSKGNAVVAGGTESIDFPVTNGAFDTTSNAPLGTMTGFVSKLNPSGTGLVYSTYVGGSKATSIFSIALDSSGNAFAAGGTAASDFPQTAWGIVTFGKPGNAFVVRLPPTGSQLDYSDVFGGNGGEYAAGVAVDSADAVYVTGPTGSVDFPVTQGAYQQTRLSAGSNTVFVSKINPSGTAFVYSSYLGGSTDEVSTAIAIDTSLNAYVTGSTRSTDFPVSATAFQKTKTTGTTQTTGFVTKVNAAGSALVYSSYLGGSVLDQPAGIAVNSAGQAFVTGRTWSSDFPVTAGAVKTVKGSGTPNEIGFVTRINAAGSALGYSTFLGGSANTGATAIALDTYSNAFVTGKTTSDDFPVTPGAIQTIRSGADAFVSKLNPTGSALRYSTFLGGSQNDYANAIAVSSSGRAYIAGGTESTDFPTTYGALQGANGASAGVTAFVADLDLSRADGRALATTTTLTASANPVTPGRTVKFIASVNPADGVVMPTGSVTFTIDGKAVDTEALDSGGLASYSTSSLLVGSHTVSVAYDGNSSFAASTSGVLTEVVKLPQVSAPAFSPAAGAYTSAQQVAISDSTPNTVIHYTVDGTTPTARSAQYTAPIKVSTTTTIKALGTAAGYSDSLVSSATYTITLDAVAPVFSPAPGTYGAAQLVTVVSTTANATIYFTTDGSVPTTSSTKYLGPIAVYSTKTIKAIATAPGYTPSPVGSGTYKLVASPQVMTGLASSISASSATLNAAVNDRGVTSSVWFVWGASRSSLTSSTAKVTASASSNTQPASAALTGLASKTRYYFRPVASTVGGTSYGAVQSFTTH